MYLFCFCLRDTCFLNVFFVCRWRHNQQLIIRSSRKSVDRQKQEDDDMERRGGGDGEEELMISETSDVRSDKK